MRHRFTEHFDRHANLCPTHEVSLIIVELLALGTPGTAYRLRL
jgi:hypothetical protein